MKKEAMGIKAYLFTFSVEKHHRDKQEQFLRPAVWNFILIFPALCMPCVGSSTHSSIFFHRANAARA